VYMDAHLSAIATLPEITSFFLKVKAAPEEL
jgi:hypothetical protein